MGGTERLLPLINNRNGNQGVWLQQAYRLEFLGESTFFPGLFGAGLAFFAVNCWVLGVMVEDVGKRGDWWYGTRGWSKGGERKGGSGMSKSTKKV